MRNGNVLTEACPLAPRILRRPCFDGLQKGKWITLTDSTTCETQNFVRDTKRDSIGTPDVTNRLKHDGALQRAAEHINGKLFPG